MARKTLRDDDGNEYDVDLPDDDKDDDDDDAIYLDAEDIEWLKRKRLEESETARKQTTSRTDTSSQKTGKVVRIRAKQDNTGGSAQRAAASQTKSRKRVLKLA